jgi:hypothetical protein
MILLAAVYVCLLQEKYSELKKNSIGSYVKTKSSHGGHLEYPISKRFTHLVQDHPMIIPAKSQLDLVTVSGNVF